MDDGLRQPMRVEHGLSLWAEVTPITGEPAFRVLLDTGQTGLFLQNAAAQGIDVRTADLAVVSHGHYDHSGGLPSLVELFRTAEQQRRKAYAQG